MLAAFLAAFMSTISTQINWGASYLINDLYRPFIKKNASEKHYVRVSVITVIALAILGGAVSFFMNNIFLAWLLFSAINAGIGIVYIIRWYWWRVNAWSEISAIASILAIVAAILFTRSEIVLKIILTSMVGLTFIALAIWGLRKKAWRAQYMQSSIFTIFIIILAIGLVLTITLPEKNFPWTLIYAVPITMAIWLTATMLTRPTDEKHLIEFYKRVHPGGPGWKRIADKISVDYSASSLFTKKNLVGAVFGVIATYSALIGFGCLMLERIVPGIILMGVLIVSIYISIKNLSNEKWGVQESITNP